MSKIKLLWSYALVRLPIYWFVSFWVLLGIFAVVGDARLHHHNANLGAMIFAWSLILGLPIVWVWRRLFGRLILRLVRTVNKAAE